jgi:transcriptional regulator
MYIPRLHREEDRETVLAFLRENDFPALVTFDGQKPVATHLPVEVVEGSDGMTIYGHMSRANPQWKTFGEQEALLIFQGPHTYISARWYNHVNVPTWNYMIAHVYGQLREVGGEELYSLLSRLVKKHEPSASYRLEGLPRDFVEKEIKGVVGFAMDVARIEAAYKLSQNRNEEDHANVIRQLDQRSDEYSHDIAEAMRRTGGKKIDEAHDLNQ